MSIKHKVTKWKLFPSFPRFSKAERNNYSVSLRGRKMAQAFRQIVKSNINMQGGNSQQSQGDTEYR